MKESQGMQKSLFVQQTVKYIITGGASFCIDYALYFSFSFIVHYEIATFIGLLAGLCVNYALSKFWVFNNRVRISKRELTTFILFTAFGFALTAAGMYIGVDIIKSNDKIVKFVVAMIVFILNFIARKFIIFKND